MADNVQLNPGSGGATLRTLQTAGGLDYPVGVFAYATTLSPGANAVQIVDATHGLPTSVIGAVEVEQADEAALNATAYQGGMWTVALAGGATVAISGTVAATQSGAWSVSVPGTVAVTQSGTWTVDLATEAAIEAVAGDSTSSIYDGTTALTPKFAKISASASGDNTIVAAVATSKIRVLRWGLTADGDVSAKWRSATSDITGARPLTKYASAGGAYCPVGCFETDADAPLVLNLSEAVAVGGELTYVVIPV